MNKPAAITGKIEIEQLNQFIDQAIDDLFVPRSQMKTAPEPEPEPVPEPVEEVAPPEPETPSALETEEISWDQGASSAPTDEEEEESGPRHPALRPIHEAMLSLDWDINQDTIGTLEKRLQELTAQLADNSHVQAAIKLGFITCKYLRASKSLATPLAPRFLHEMIKGFDVFLSGRAPGQPSPDALMNDLLGLYNQMKLDANRLRVTEIKRREDKAEAPAPSPSAPAQSAAPQPYPSPAPRQEYGQASYGADGMRELRIGLNDLWDRMEQIRGRLRGAAAQGAPFAESIDSACAQAQTRLSGLLDLAQRQSPDRGLADLSRTAGDLNRALSRFQEELGKVFDKQSGAS